MFIEEKLKGTEMRPYIVAWLLLIGITVDTFTGVYTEKLAYNLGFVPQEGVGLIDLRGHPFTVQTISLWFAALLEECLFRLPLAIAISRNWSLRSVILAAVLLSILFGRVHGSWFNVLMQGVSGFIYSIIFLYTGGLERKYGKAIVCSTTAHFLYNFRIFIR